MAGEFEVELERRLALFEDPASDEGVLPGLPSRDLVVAVLALVVVGALLLWWAY
jgi:hypothetical protein